MTLERAYIVYFPFGWQKFNAIKILISIIILTIITFLSLCEFYLLGYFPTPLTDILENEVYHHCRFYDLDEFIYYTFFSIDQIITFGIHTILTTIFTILICTKMIIAKFNRQTLMANGNIRNSPKINEIQSTIIMLLLNVFDIIIFIPNMIVYIIYITCFGPCQEALLDSIYSCIESISPIAHSFNIIVYLARIESFRKEVMNRLKFFHKTRNNSVV